LHQNAREQSKSQADGDDGAGFSEKLTRREAHDSALDPHARITNLTSAHLLREPDIFHDKHPALASRAHRIVYATPGIEISASWNIISMWCPLRAYKNRIVPCGPGRNFLYDAQHFGGMEQRAVAPIEYLCERGEYPRRSLSGPEQHWASTMLKTLNATAAIGLIISGGVQAQEMYHDMRGQPIEVTEAFPWDMPTENSFSAEAVVRWRRAQAPPRALPRNLSANQRENWMLAFNFLCCANTPED
jgi:hypothetical protein